MSEYPEDYVPLEFDDEEMSAIETAAAIVGIRVDWFILTAARIRAVDVIESDGRQRRRHARKLRRRKEVR